MTWLVWRQYRTSGAIACALLAAFAAVIVATGTKLASQWHTLLASCASTNTCRGLTARAASSLGSGPLGHDFVVLSIMVPALVGLLWGAPLVAHEIEAGTTNFAWTQSATRTRWLAVKAGWLLLASAVLGGGVAALVTWWSGPSNAAFQQQFQFNYFDRQGVVPIGYALFAAALGITAGALLRRTLPAIAVTIGGFIGMRLFVSQSLRQQFMTPVTAYINPMSNYYPPGSPWVLGQGVVDKYGHVYSGGSAPQVDGVPITAVPASCRSLLFTDPSALSKAKLHEAISCMQASGYRGFLTYQPSNRFWAFQGIETGLFAAVAAALLAVSFIVVTRRDA
jgi:hypothetical protein